MRKFLIQVLVFFLIVAGSLALLVFQADGYTDPYYKKFTVKKQKNLIIGSSRAAQGIQPKVLEDKMQRTFFNFSFSLKDSPYGPLYFESIKQKLDTSDRNGIFIVEVNPWSIASKCSDPNDSTLFRENTMFLGDDRDLNQNPNIMYIYENMQGQYYRLLLGSFYRIIGTENAKMYLHDSGWLEISVDMDSVSVRQRTDKKLLQYKQESEAYKFSAVRYNYLRKTLLFLKKYGRVYLVRLPTHCKMTETEKDMMPNFEQLIIDLSSCCDAYFDYSEDCEKYRYTDGNHLYKESAAKLSVRLAGKIKRSYN